MQYNFIQLFDCVTLCYIRIQVQLSLIPRFNVNVDAVKLNKYVLRAHFDDNKMHSIA